MDEYDAEFSRLYRFALELVDKAENRARCFCNGLTFDLREKLAWATLNTQAEVLTTVKSCVAVAKKRLQFTCPHPSISSDLALAHTSSFKKAGASRTAQPIQSISDHCQKSGHLAKDYWRLKNACFNCEAIDHFAS